MPQYLEYPLAYHITFGTYGTRLHGDERGTVSRNQNRFGDPIIGKDIVWQRIERSQLKFAPVVLTEEQQEHVETAVPPICTRGNWEFHIAAGQPDHVHVLLTTPNEGKKVRKWLKRWLGEALSVVWPTVSNQTWWAEGGSVKTIWDHEYFANVFNYIHEQRTTPLESKIEDE